MSLEWKIDPPPSSQLTDRDVRLTGSHLSGKRVALLITGSIAAYRMPDLVRDFRREGADVVVYATNEDCVMLPRRRLNGAHRIL